MKNPFVKLVSETEPSFEEKKVVDTDFEVREDEVYVRDIYEDGTVSLEWTPLYVDPSDSEAAREAYKAYRQSKGIVEEPEINI